MGASSLLRVSRSVCSSSVVGAFDVPGAGGAFAFAGVRSPRRVLFNRRPEVARGLQLAVGGVSSLRLSCVTRVAPPLACGVRCAWCFCVLGAGGALVALIKETGGFVRLRLRLRARYRAS